MLKLDRFNNRIFKCSSCNKQYSTPLHEDESTGDKMYDYELIDTSFIQTECTYCRTFNYIKQ